MSKKEVFTAFLYVVTDKNSTINTPKIGKRCGILLGQYIDFLWIFAGSMFIKRLPGAAIRRFIIEK